MIGLVSYLVLFGATPVVLAESGPAESFIENPVKYWLDYSNNVDVVWDSFAQTVELDNDSSDAWLDGWLYRMAHIINGSGSAGTNYQVNFTIYNITGTTSGGSVYLGSKVNSDFSDVRFTDNDGVTLLDYWIESYTSVSCLVWVEVADSLSSDVVVYLYYGNSGASDLSDGDDTFPFFDDFNDDSIDGTKWTTEWMANGVVTESNGVVHVVGGSGSTYQSFTAIIQYGQGYAMRASAMTDEQDSCNLGLDERSIDGSYQGSGWSDAAFINDGTAYYRTTDEGTQDKDARGVMLSGGYHTVDICRGPSSTYFYIGDTLRHTMSDEISSDDMGVKLICRGPSTDGYMDYVFIRKFVVVAPFHGGWDSQETAGLNVYVPVNVASRQSIDFMINATVLGATGITFDFYQNSTSAGLYIVINGSHVVYPDVTSTGSRYVAHDGIIRISYSLNGERDRFQISQYYLNETRVCVFSEPFGRAGNNWFRMYSVGYDAWSCLYYLSGDVNYSVVYNWFVYPDWDKELSVSGDEADSVTQSLMSFGYVGTDDLDYSCVYRADLAEFRYIRTEWVTYLDIFDASREVADWIWIRQSLNVTWVDGKQVSFMVSMLHDAATPDGYLNGTVVVYDASGSILFQSSEELDSSWSTYYDAGYYGDIMGKVGIWKTQERHIGLMFYDEANVWDENYTAADWEDDTNYTLWIGDVAYDDWDVEVSLGFECELQPYTTDGFPATLLLEFQMCEYEYLNLGGVVQPHFSSVWWADTPGTWARWAPGEDGLIHTEETFEEAPNPLFDPIGWIIYHVRNFFLGGINVLADALGWIGAGIANWIWAVAVPVLLDFMEELIAVGIDTLVAVLNVVGGTIWGDASFGTNIVSFGGSVLGLATAFFYLGLWFVTNVAFVLDGIAASIDMVSFILSYYIQPLFWVLIVAFLGYYFVKAVKYEDPWEFLGAVEIIVGILAWIVSAFLWLLEFMIGIVVNLIPFT